MAPKIDELKKKLKAQQEDFKKKEKQLMARIQMETARERKVRDKIETHVKVVIGAIAIEIAERDENVQKKLQEWVQGYLESRPGDWSYFQNFPKKKDGSLLMKLSQPKGWAAVAASRKKKASKEKE